MTERLRAVFDTNVFVAAFLSRNPTSPTKELIKRWLDGEFTLIMCELLMAEILAKLYAHAIAIDEIREFIFSVIQIAADVDLSIAEIPSLIPADPDDDVVIACAVKAKADYLVTYDPHFDVLGGEYGGVKIVKALPFLWAVRGDRPPGD